MTGNPGYPLEGEDAGSWNTRPAIQRRMFDPQLAREGYNATGLFGPFANNFDHCAKVGVTYNRCQVRW